MNIKYNGQYKSINSFEWNDIPMLAIITGPNGSGKTQLLELINGRTKAFQRSADGINAHRERYNNFSDSMIPGLKPSTQHHYLVIQFPGEFTYEDGFYTDIDIMYLQSKWEMQDTQDISMGKLDNVRINYFNNFKNGSFDSAYQTNPSLVAIFQSIQNEIGGNRQEVTRPEFDKLFPNVVFEQETGFAQKLGELFFHYRISEIQLQAKGKDRNEIDEEIGKKPWQVLRDIISEAKLPFTINDPESMDIRDTFELKIKHAILNKEIKLSGLSSGEKVLLSLVIHLYNFEEKLLTPKIILMDEPDAHLHPSMAQQFINVVNNVFVQKLGIRVIITTHSPSTVVMSPEDSIFIMSIESPRIRKANNKNEALALLTSGLVYVGPGTKYFLVEDKDDVSFYTYIYQRMIQDLLLSSDIPLVFIPASTENKSGGKDQVMGWVKKLQESGIQKIIHGLIDEDNGNEVFEGIEKIERYSIENYLCDPLFIYAALLDKEKAPKIHDIDLSVGEEYRLKSMDTAKLQSLCDVILDKIEKELPNLFSDFDTEVDCLKKTVTYTNGIELQLPNWIITRRGKTLLREAINTAYGSTTVNFATLTKAMKKLNIFPVDLKILFIRLAS